MSAARSHDVVPKGALMLAAALIMLVLALTVAVRTGLLAPAPSADELRRERGVSKLAERSLRFSDAADGAVLVDDARTGGRVAVIPSAEGGFIRGVMRGLARERRMHGIGSSAPFRLTMWANGALSLTDPATGRNLELSGFGPSNHAAFAQLLEGGA